MSEVKSEWTDNVDTQRCLCCGQLVLSRGRWLAPDAAEAKFKVLESLGFTQERLLSHHRHQIDYQTPGLAEWLEFDREEMKAAQTRAYLAESKERRE